MSSISTTSDSDRYERLAAKVEFPTGWKPSKDATHPRTLVGDVVRWDSVEIDDYLKPGHKRAVDVLVLRDRDGQEWGVWCIHKVLELELVGRAREGSFIAISYVGEGRTQDDRPIQRYRVAIDDVVDGDVPVEETGDDSVPY